MNQRWSANMRADEHDALLWVKEFGLDGSGGMIPNLEREPKARVQGFLSSFLPIIIINIIRGSRSFSPAVYRGKRCIRVRRSGNNAWGVVVRRGWAACAGRR